MLRLSQNWSDLAVTVFSTYLNSVVKAAKNSAPNKAIPAKAAWRMNAKSTLIYSNVADPAHLRTSSPRWMRWLMDQTKMEKPDRKVVVLPTAKRLPWGNSGKKIQRVETID